MEFVVVVVAVATFHLHLVQQLHNFWTVVKCRTKIVGVGVEPLTERLTEPFPFSELISTTHKIK